MGELDAVVVGSGPNGLAAALTLARAGWSVLVVEGDDRPGGGCRSGALTGDGFVNDVCAAVHPLLAVSPFFAGLGVRLVTPEASFAHPLDGGRAAVAWRSLERTVDELGRDGPTYRRLLAPLVDRVQPLGAAVLAPPLAGLRAAPAAGPRALARLGGAAMLPSSRLWGRFGEDRAGVLLAGAAAHAGLPLDRRPVAALGLFLVTLAHAAGWPVVEGGSGAVVSGLLERIDAAGGRVETGRPVRRLSELPDARAVLLDVAPRHLVELCGDRLRPGVRRAAGRFRHGPGVCKVDWALSAAVPWAADGCRQAATVHLGGTVPEVASALDDVALGRHPAAPFVIVVQPTVVDPTRAPAGGHTLWAYCHVPSGSTVDVADQIETQIERFAPGFRQTVQHRVVTTAAAAAAANPNRVGGDLGGGAVTLGQLLARPVPSPTPSRVGPGLYLCSASTPPGPGVHGMCGWWAAQAVLSDERRGRLGTGGG